MIGTATLFSSASVEWETPQDLFAKLDAIHHFTLDVCATKKNTKCARYFTKKQDAHAKPWAGEVAWCNPPYGRGIGIWVKRCSEAGRNAAWEWWAPKRAVMLLPARTDTRWWHDYVIPYGQIEFIRGRLKFGGHKNSAPFPSAVVTFCPTGNLVLP